MSTLRVSNIEAKADVSSPTVDEKIKFTNSSGNVLFHLDGKTSGITTVGINTTGNTFTVNNTTGDVSFSGSVTSSGVSTFTSDVSIADKIVHIGDTDTAIRFPAADTITAETGGTERLRIDSSGRLIVGVNGATSTICSAIFQGRSDGATNSAAIRLAKGSSTPGTTDSLGIIQFSDNGTKHAAQIQAQRDEGTWTSGTQTPAALLFFTSPDSATGATERLRITSAGNITHTYSDSSTTTSTQLPPGLRIYNTDNTLGRLAGIHFAHGAAGSANAGIFHVTTDTDTTSAGCLGDLAFYMKADASSTMTERMRIDSSGRLLVGTTSTSSNNLLVVAGTTGGNPGFIHLQTKSTTPGSADQIGGFNFGTANDTAAARISASRDGGTWTAGSSTPTAIAFAITADSATAHKEKLRLKSDGVLASTNFETFLQLHGAADASTPSSSSTYNCVAIRGGQGQIQVSAQNTIAFDINRRFSDGTLVNFRGDGTIEGTIQISGTTISLSGAHLTRWSQLPGGVERTEILRGTVLSNIDEMCDWGEEENEQLNRMKVSDVEGDKNVSGVFQAWDDDDDTYTNDFYCAMTGDFVIRIGAGVTVARGDLLMSAGDGTAKPQDDDIIRSKTIAKVTSTHISETYADGSYCVPCVLMAC